MHKYLGSKWVDHDKVCVWLAPESIFSYPLITKPTNLTVLCCSAEENQNQKQKAMHICLCAPTCVHMTEFWPMRDKWGCPVGLQRHLFKGNNDIRLYALTN